MIIDLGVVFSKIDKRMGLNKDLKVYETPNDENTHYGN